MKKTGRTILVIVVLLALAIAAYYAGVFSAFGFTPVQQSGGEVAVELSIPARGHLLLKVREGPAK